MNRFQSALLNRLAQHPSTAPAVGNGQGPDLNYGALLCAVRTVAEQLTRLRVPGLAVRADNGPEHLVIDLACLEAGIWHLPLPPFFTEAQCQHALRTSGCELCLVQADQMPQDTPSRPATLQVLDTAFAMVPSSATAVSLPNGTRKVTFTSGSTGQPSGLCLSEQQLLAPAQAVTRALDGIEVTRHLSVLPHAVLLENVAGLYAALYRGMHCTIPRCHETLTNSGPADNTLVSLVARHRIHTAIVVPEQLRHMRRACEAGQPVPEDLRFLAVGGSTVSPSELERAVAAGLPVYQGYGLSEAASVVTLNRPGKNRVGSVGCALDHQSVRISADNEVLIRDGGYLGECGAHNTANTQLGGWFQTGDLGRLDNDGFLYITGRRKNVLITAFGRNVSPEWVEAELTAEDAIHQACVYGDGRPALQALIVSDGCASRTVSAVARANRRLPDYARIVAWQQVPPFTADTGQLTGNGKLRRDTIERDHSALMGPRGTAKSA